MQGDMFGGIFDGISGLFDDATEFMNDNPAITKGLKNAGKSLFNGKEQQNPYKQMDQARDLNQNAQENANFSAPVTESKAIVSVDPFKIEAQWRERLNQFANIQAKTGVKFK